MILFLNGPFGVGKTTAARLLAEKIPGAIIHDPEGVGSFVWWLTKDFDRPDDFQDHRLWEPMVIGTARLLEGSYGGPLVVPMTVWWRGRFGRLAEGLRDVDPDLRLVRLTASEASLRSRILSRPDAEGSHSWCLEHLEVCTEALRDPVFGAEIRTDGLTAEQVAEKILEVAGRPAVVE